MVLRGAAQIVFTSYLFSLSQDDAHTATSWQSTLIVCGTSTGPYEKLGEIF